MIQHKLPEKRPLRVISAEVSLSESECKRINKLLEIKSFDDLTPDEYEELKIKKDSTEGIFAVDFNNGAHLTWDLCSGQCNYYDNVVFYYPNGDDVALDCIYKLEDIEIETDYYIYTVKINVTPDKDTRLWDERFWEPDEILWNILFKHRSHKVVIATYGDWNDPQDMCLECLDCNQVILDAETYTICARKDT